MSVKYIDERKIDKIQLEKLFMDVEWESGKYPDLLELAVQGFATVYSAWINDELVGLVCAMDDGIMNAYIQYLLVKKGFQGQGIGTNLLCLVREKYREFKHVGLISYDDKIDFYNKCGFSKMQGNVPMEISSL